MQTSNDQINNEESVNNEEKANNDNYISVDDCSDDCDDEHGNT